MKKDYTKEEIIDLLEFVDKKVSMYLKVIDDDNLDSWSLDVTQKGEKVIAIETSTVFWGDRDYLHHEVTFETLLSTTEEQIRILEEERKATEERLRIQKMKDKLEREKLREKTEYEAYLKLKNKYEK